MNGDSNEFPIIPWEPQGEPSGEDFEPVQSDWNNHRTWEDYNTHFRGMDAEDPIQPEKRPTWHEPEREPRIKTGSWLSSFLGGGFRTPRRVQPQAQPQQQEWHPVSREDARRIFNK